VLILLERTSGYGHVGGCRQKGSIFAKKTVLTDEEPSSVDSRTPLPSIWRHWRRSTGASLFHGGVGLPVSSGDKSDAVLWAISDGVRGGRTARSARISRLDSARRVWSRFLEVACPAPGSVDCPVLTRCPYHLIFETSPPPGSDALRTRKYRDCSLFLRLTRPMMPRATGKHSEQVMKSLWNLF
jgi:hypothetical protein